MSKRVVVLGAKTAPGGGTLLTLSLDVPKS